MTMPTVWKLPRSASLVTTAGLMSTQTRAHAGRQHVADGDAVQHRREHQAGAAPAARSAASRFCACDHVGDHVGHRAVVADAAGEHERRARLDERVHEAAGDHALVDGGLDGAAAADGVDGAQVMLVTAGDRRAVLEADRPAMCRTGCSRCRGWPRRCRRTRRRCSPPR